MVKVHTTAKYHRVRIKSPTECSSLVKIAKRGKGIAALRKKGVKLTVCCPKGKVQKGRCQVGMVTQAVLYDKKEFTKTEAKRHAKKRFM